MSSDETLPNDNSTDSSTPAAPADAETAAAAAEAVTVPETAATETSPVDVPAADAEASPAAEISPAGAVSELPASDPGQVAVQNTAAAAVPSGPEQNAEAEGSGESTAETTPLEVPAPRKVVLNPTGGEALKAAGTVSGPAGDTAEQDAEAADAEVLQAAAELAAASAEPVVIPDADEVDLGGLDAEIEAAMAGETREAEAADSVQTELPEEGARVEGIVQSVHGDDVFLDLGFRIPGVAALRQFDGKPPEIGKKLRIVVRKVDEAEGLIAVNLPGGKQRLGGNWEAVEIGQVVDCTVSKTNKGGLEVSVGSMRAFLPASQIDLAYVESLESYVGQKLQVKITEANAKKRNLVVSRRALLIEERKSLEQEFWEGVQERSEHTGRVKTIKDYGAFVDLGGADGFLHIGQIAWAHIKHPNEVLSEGQEVTVKVTKVDREKHRIGLSMKELTQNPWVVAADRYAAESTVSGNVTRVTDFGAFVELEPGIEGLIHISELDHRRVRKVTDVVRVGQEVTAKVLEFDRNRKRVSMSLKALTEDPRIAEDAAADKAYQEEVAKRKPRKDLRGGISSPGAAGGLFGNPSDFE